MAKVFCIFGCLLTQNPTNQGSEVSWFFQTIWKAVRKSKKTGGSREVFLPENDFQTSFTVNFPKKHPDFEGLETNQRHENQTWIFFHMPFYIWPQYNTKIVWALYRNIFKVPQVLRAKFLKNHLKRLKNCILQFFQLYISGSTNPRELVFYSLKLRKKFNISN